MEKRRIEYATDGETAVKIVAPVGEYKKECEIYDILNKEYINTSQLWTKTLASMLSEVVANWKNITEEEYDKITNN